jgi:hypothetical protein
VDPLSLVLTLVAGKKHLVHLAVQVGKFAVGLLEKLFSPWIGFNNGQTACQMRGVIHCCQLRTHYVELQVHAAAV